ncbi:GNAT family N-acetyltransferase [Terrabacter lapilli]|uniref:GNAT family N-acetyltransferase n=1 Tax=Terrabacter lapilli TaxID=436231 RepID=UPI0031E1AD9B
MPRQPDRLPTARLSLRRPAQADAVAVLGILSDPAVVQHNPSERVTELEDVEVLMRHWLAHWERHGFGNCCVFETPTGRLIGNCGVRWMTMHGDRVLNLMYRFDPSTWGHGYATEAAGALVHWAQDSIPGELVVARIRPTNLASQRVATKIGLRRDPAFDDEGEDGGDWAFTDRS